jgi:hypothetical protein
VSEPQEEPAVTERPAASAPAGQEQSLLAQVVDIVRYAPIAILLDGPSMLPKLAEQGKVHMRNARYLGNKAARELEPQARRLLGALGEQAGELLKLTGLVPETPDDADGIAPRARRGPRPAVPEPATERGNGQRGNGQTPPYDGPDLDELAIPGYDSLSASHVLNRLPGLSTDELEAVRRYEAGHRGRKTILNRIAQLQA